MGHAGFDASGYSGDAEMAELKRATNFEWCGFYLGPAPSHSDAGWMTRRTTLAAQGWGFAPVYVGQQVTGPGSHIITAAQGSKDGNHAAQLMLHAGFPSGSFVYLDLENGPPFGAAQQEYVGDWVDAVIASGFGAGVYCSFLFAAEVAKLRPAARIWVFHVRTETPHAVAGVTFKTPDPSTSGFAGASIWQYDDEARLTALRNLGTDLDSAAMADPSAPAPAARLAQAAVTVNQPSTVSPIPSPTAAERVQTVAKALTAVDPKAAPPGWWAKLEVSIAALEAHIVEAIGMD